jgi:hemolysin III
MKRTKLAQHTLPNYTKGEETMNTVTHIIGGALSCVMLAICIIKPILNLQLYDLVGAVIYGVSLLSVYTISSIYHGLHPGTAKKVMQIIDHCMIYFLIAGTYTPIILCGFIAHYPVIGCIILCIEWGLGITAAVLTAIDLKHFRIFSMLCYMIMGWCMILFLPQALHSLGKNCFALILCGGVVYTLGAVLFGLGTRIKWMHAIFHIFVVLGSVLHFIGITLYIL